MAFKISNKERGLLYGLPHIQQLLYYAALRPYMDYSTGVIGVKRGISHRSLQEELYVESHQGRKESMPSRQQVRRALNNLARVGLIEFLSTERKLILKCLAADINFSENKKADTYPTSQVGTGNINNFLREKAASEEKIKNVNISINEKADTPQGSGINNIKTHTYSKQIQTLINHDFYPASTTIQKAKLLQYDNVSSDCELAKFIAFHTSKGTRSWNWDAEYFYWVLSRDRNKQGVKQNVREFKAANTRPLSAVERVANANRHIFQDRTIQEARDNHRERYLLAMDGDDSSIWPSVCE